jgi:hypothetical protein
MGTRAVVRFRGKPVLATHWDGDPDSLGKELRNAKPRNLNQIIAVAKPHSIDFAGKDFAGYGDYAEYEYNVDKNGTVTFRELSGEWKPKKFSKKDFRSLSSEKRKVKKLS